MRTGVFSLFLCLLIAGCGRHEFAPVILEPQITVSAVNGNDLRIPPLATSRLPCEAVGIEGVLQKFEPVMYLAQPVPRYGGSSKFFEANAPRRFRVYRGDNEIAAKNKFLGEFEIVGPANPAESVEAMIGFKVNDQRQLLLSVTDIGGNHVLNVRRIDTLARQ